jgi:hypothetical protein
MSKPMAGMPIQEIQPAARPDRSMAGAASRQAQPKHEKPTLEKPMGPVIYRLEKGADVWPGRK